MIILDSAKGVTAATQQRQSLLFLRPVQFDVRDRQVPADKFRAAFNDCPGGTFYINLEKDLRISYVN